MQREISAGGVVVRRLRGRWHLAAIVPQGRAARPSNSGKTKPVLALPKGLVDAGERPAETAVREVLEETGLTAEIVAKLGDIKYVYQRAWGDRARVFKIVSFYLLRYESGKIDDISEDMRIEVGRARWVRLEEAPKLLAYRGEKQMARKALDYIASDGHL